MLKLNVILVFLSFLSLPSLPPLLQLIKQRIEELRVSDGRHTPNSPVYSVAIDYWLWNYAKTQAKVMTQFPIHHTRTIFY